MKIEIGTSVISKKGNGIITKIITKSTGYVEVTLANGNVIKEMAFNLTDENGVNLKEKKVTATTGMNAMQKKMYKESFKACNSEFESRLNYALSQETGRTGSNQFLKSI